MAVVKVKPKPINSKRFFTHYYLTKIFLKNQVLSTKAPGAAGSANRKVIYLLYFWINGPCRPFQKAIETEKAPCYSSYVARGLLVKSELS